MLLFITYLPITTKFRWAYFKPGNSKYWSNSAFDGNTVSETGARSFGDVFINAHVICVNSLWPIDAIYYQWIVPYRSIRWWYIMMTSSNGNSFRVTGPLCGEFTGHRFSPIADCACGVVLLTTLRSKFHSVYNWWFVTYLHIRRPF